MFWVGKKSFDGLSLHNIGEFPNPYEQAISIIGQTLSKFDDDNLIPCFGFGDGIVHCQQYLIKITTIFTCQIIY